MHSIIPKHDLEIFDAFRVCFSTLSTAKRLCHDSCFPFLNLEDSTFDGVGNLGVILSNSDRSKQSRPYDEVFNVDRFLLSNPVNSVDSYCGEY